MKAVPVKALLCALALSGLLAGSANARSMIEKACLRAGRDDASQALCACIQAVANQQLKGADQRLAASFFKDPHKAQVIRQSERQRHKLFWQRYKSFGLAAEESCGEAGSDPA